MCSIAELSRLAKEQGINRSQQQFVYLIQKRFIPPPLLRQGNRLYYSQSQAERIISLLVKHQMKKGKHVSQAFLMEIREF